MVVPKNRDNRGPTQAAPPPGVEAGEGRKDGGLTPEQVVYCEGSSDNNVTLLCTRIVSCIEREHHGNREK